MKNLKKFAVKGVILISLIFVVIFIFKFPIDYFNLEFFSINQATQIINKADALKLSALAGLFFAIYYRERIEKIRHERPEYQKSILYAAGGIILVAAYFSLRYLSNRNSITEGFAFYLVFSSSIIILASAMLAFAIGVFGLSYLGRFYKSLRKELIYALLITIAAYVLMTFFQGLWPYLSGSISVILLKMFSLFFPSYLEFSDDVPYLDVNGFAVSIGAPCSGIESIFLFIAFTIGIYALDHKRIRKRFWIISAAGLIGIYFVNILRLFLLILTGIHISPDFAVGLFHTNAGWLLFVVYFLSYYYLIRKYIYTS